MRKKQPTKYLAPKDVASHAYQWNCEQLEEMQAIIDGLLEAQSLPSPPEIAAPVAQSPQRGKYGGSYIEEKTINGCGPYQYLRYRHGGKFRSAYVGKVSSS